MPNPRLLIANPVLRAILAGATLGLMVTLSLPALTDTAGSDDNSSAAAATSRGGRLYDNWMIELAEKPPQTVNPSYPATGSKAGDPAATWRCVQCHGWDYTGNEGMPGILAAAGRPAGEIIALLKAPPHGYDQMMDEPELRALGLFVAEGLIDMAPLIDQRSGRAKGNPGGNKDYYQTICAVCHGPFGQRMTDFVPLGDFARKSPSQALHKAMNGHPGDVMPPLRVLGTKTLVDLLAYLQTLPPRETLSSVVRGGRLYDNWWREKRVEPPATPHPAYPKSAAAQKPGTTWRCKECHGWDYKGRDGAYADGPHKTGIVGIMGMRMLSTGTIKQVLSDQTHALADQLDARDLTDLAIFIAEGQIDMDRYIDPKTAKAKGSPAKAKAVYETICGTCHGPDGRDVRTVPPLGREAIRDPWATLHKILNGHPDEAMPALRAADTGLITDLLAYVQSLPADK